MPPSEARRVRRYSTTPDLIADSLRDDILRGDFRPGAALRQEELANRFGVSRLPIRDALFRLEAEGLVDIYPNRGAFVISLSPREVEEIYHLRVLLEGDAIELAVPRMTAAHWRRIDAAHAASAQSAGGPGWVEGDRDFHLALYEAADRPRQLAMIGTLRGTVDRYWTAYAELPSRSAEWLSDHDAIVDACRAGDATGARERLTDHLRRASALVVSLLEPE
jgi:DNA-binding GntR family transcriptional regulator